MSQHVLIPERKPYFLFTAAPGAGRFSLNFSQAECFNRDRESGSKATLIEELNSLRIMAKLQACG
jgi:hypothetical protein